MYKNRFWTLGIGILRVWGGSPLVALLLPVKLVERASTENADEDEGVVEGLRRK